MQGGEDDLDALLKQFELKDKKANEIVVLSNAEPPSARLFASFTAVPGSVFFLGIPLCKILNKFV